MASFLRSVPGCPMQPLAKGQIYDRINGDFDLLSSMALSRYQGMPQMRMLNECPNPFRGYRFPKEYARMLFGSTIGSRSRFRSEAAMATRGVVVSYETIRRWSREFGHQYRGRAEETARPDRGQVASG